MEWTAESEDNSCFQPPMHGTDRVPDLEGGEHFDEDLSGSM
jgi:type IV secretory pathway VirJ component